VTLRKREKALILAVGLLVLTGAYYLLLVSPALSHQERLARSLEELGRDLRNMEGLRAEWLAFVAAREHAEALLERRGGDFSLLSFMESITRKVGVGDRIAYMKPLSFSDEEEKAQKAVGIEIQLDGLRMKDLVRLLHETEYSGKLLRVRRIKIRANSEQEQRDLKVTLQVETFIQGV
jgi:hypothetical protein